MKTESTEGERVYGTKERKKERRKEKREDRECFFEIGRTSIHGYRGRMLVRRVGELFRKQARPSPSSNGRESISGPSPVERKELLPTGQDLCPTYI